MLAGAVQKVRQGWMPPREGGELSTRISDAMPPLTTGDVDLYLAAYAWLWDRETPPEERARVTRTIEADAMTAWTRMDYRIRHGVLAVCALWTEIQTRTPEDGEAIRDLMGPGPPPGVYPELQPPSVEPEGSPGIEVEKKLVTTHDVVMGALRTQFETGPGF